MWAARIRFAGWRLSVRCRGEVSWVALWSALLHPGGNNFNVLLRQAGIVSEFAKPSDRVPWRHTSRTNLLSNLPRPRPHSSIGHERNGRSSFVVAGRAVPINNSRYVSRPGDLGAVNNVSR